MSVFRFAPSPNGALHLGHAYSALLNEGLARRSGGALLLRIEDIDQERCRPEFEAGILADLDWLGIGFDGETRRQSEHFDDYAAALARLRDMRLLYPGFMSRAETALHVAEWERSGRVWPRDPDGAQRYPSLDRDLPASEAEARIAEGAPYAMRLDMRRALARVGALSWSERGDGREARVAADPLAWGDVVLAGRTMPTSYHLSVVVDDALQGVSDVVRGRDLYAATSVHRLLQALLSLPEPRYLHHRLILDRDGRKLAKSARDTGLTELRNAGLTAGDIRRMVGVEEDLAGLEG